MRSKSDYGVMILAGSTFFFKKNYCQFLIAWLFSLVSPCLSDKRYAQNDKRKKLPEVSSPHIPYFIFISNSSSLTQWIGKFLKVGNVNISTETAVDMTQSFLRRMSQPIESASASSALWALNDVITAAVKANPNALKVRHARKRSEENADVLEFFFFFF